MSLIARQSGLAGRRRVPRCATTHGAASCETERAVRYLDIAHWRGERSDQHGAADGGRAAITRGGSETPVAEAGGAVAAG
eukprot:4891541-Prymnesium_polylepis.2